ncbi:MAG: hypothetical protein H7336_02510 [Bacteriovorax sp.]|nr:hypothetical protein [Bacteriovorax sp.]
MGLMYIFPVTDNASEGDRIEIRDQELSLKTYGLPMIFWGYLAAAVSVVVIMWLAARAVILKLLTYTEDPSMLFLGNLVKWTLILAPFVMLAFFFYEKILSKKDRTVTVTHKLFFIPFWKKTYQLKDKTSVVVEHFMDSPNMAKIRARQGLPSMEAMEMKGFENKGYFELNIETADNKSVNIDRHSRKADLVKMKDLLTRY